MPLLPFVLETAVRSFLTEGINFVPEFKFVMLCVYMMSSAVNIGGGESMERAKVVANLELTSTTFLNPSFYAIKYCHYCMKQKT